MLAVPYSLANFVALASLIGLLVALIRPRASESCCPSWASQLAFAFVAF
jgi:hypothetical protein